MQKKASPSSCPSSSDYDRCGKAVATSVADNSRSVVGMKPGLTPRDITFATYSILVYYSFAWRYSCRYVYALGCWPCVLFPDDLVWPKNGVSDVNCVMNFKHRRED
jgi:hypothetical protein